MTQRPASTPGVEILIGDGTVFLDGRAQSHVDLTDPTRLTFDYVRRLAEVLDAVAPAGEPIRVLHVGGGGLTLPRYVAATRPTSAQVVLEPDAMLTARVRAELPLPPRSGIKVRAVDGRSGLAALADGAWPVAILDAFDAGEVPVDLTTLEALGELRRVVGAAGVLAINLVDRTPFRTARPVLAGVREVFAHHRVGAERTTWAGGRAGNLVVTTSDGPLPPRPARGGREVGGSEGYRILEDDRARDAFGGSSPLRDPPTVEA